MATQIIFNAVESIKRTQQLETEIYQLEDKLSAMIFEWNELKKKNAANISIAWKESILSCLDIDESSQNFTTHFLKTTNFISNCVAWTNGMELSRDIKNKISSTLSFMYKNKDVGRIEYNGKTYYGLAKYFVDNGEKLEIIKAQYQTHLDQLAA